jgi:hypothetical protein
MLIITKKNERNTCLNKFKLMILNINNFNKVVYVYFQIIKICNLQLKQNLKFLHQRH